MNDRPSYLDRAGQPIDLMTYCRLFEDREYQHLAREERDGVLVSTIWLGVDHNFFGDGPPQIFETMVFGGPRDEEQWRWSTEAEALAGHAEICSAVFRD